MRRFVPLAIALLVPSWGSAQDGRPQDKSAPDLKDEKYGPHERNVLDLWKAKSDKPTPLVIFIHGGGFRAGNKEQISPSMLKRCLDAGISVAAINYRLSQQAIFPAPFHDCARAVQYMRSKAKEWNLNPERFAATGGSAGGGMSLWLAFHEDLADPKNEDPVLRQSTRMCCVVGYGAQSSYDPRWIKEHIGGRAHEHDALAQLFGVKRDEILTAEKAFKMYEEASAITHLTKDDPPVYLVYGKDEPSDKPGAGIHNEKFGHALKESMDKLGIGCIVKSGGKGGSEAEQVEFFVKNLK